LFLSGQRAEQDLAAARRWLQAAELSGHAGARVLVEKISQGGRSRSAPRIRRPMWLAAIPVLALAGLSMSAGYQASRRIQTGSSQTSPSMVAQGRAPSELSSLAPKGAPSIPANADTYSLQPPSVQATIHAGAPAAVRHKSRSHKPKGK
jgi:hypothetical protein